MICVEAVSRLHFGLFTLGGATHWPGCDGVASVPARRFGGVGLMVQQPGLRIRMQPADEWSAEGPLADRALSYACRLADGLLGRTLPPQKIILEHCAAEHAGLGTGTQLALAVALAVMSSAGIPWTESFALTCASLLGRGTRSALGIYGFLQGGFLVEAGKADDEAISPLVFCNDFPADWRIVLIQLPATGLHGSAERQAFAQLQALPIPPAATDTLARLALLGMIPALLDRDLPAFGEALYDFNRRVGELFAPVQGGPYAHPAAAEVVAFLRSRGVHGVGQSSWGPTLFAVIEEARAEQLAEEIRRRLDVSVIVTDAANDGALLVQPEE
ncbi:MAG: beta-RFAP synthase [Planctomycetia bacterium]|nr:beta-RFAP synthase [Planctomycetia bacterium]